MENIITIILLLVKVTRKNTYDLEMNQQHNPGINYIGDIVTSCNINLSSGTTDIKMAGRRLSK